MKIQVVVFWDVKPCSDGVGYQHLCVSCCLHLQGGMKMVTARSSETLVLTALLHGVTTQKTTTYKHIIVPRD